MRFAALAADYDGTLAHDGVVTGRTIAALERLKASGRRLLLVTGRELCDLQRTFNRIDLFDLCVLENGATLHDPATGRERALADPPPERFVAELRNRGLPELSVGKVIVAMRESDAPEVLSAIHALGLELQLIFNKRSLMVLPSGINKATGLAAALDQIGLSRHNVVGVGDAENDHAFLAACECGVAVANALPAVKEQADLVTSGRDGAGVEELIEALIRDDLRSIPGLQGRHSVLLGRAADGSEVRFPAFGRNILIGGTPAQARRSIARSLLHQLLHAAYQVCVIDSDGSFTQNGAVVLGEPDSAPTIDGALAVLHKPERSLIVNLARIPAGDRPVFFRDLAARLGDFATSKSRPHWLIIGAAHHVLLPDSPSPLPGQLNTAIAGEDAERLVPPAFAMAAARVVAGQASATIWNGSRGAPVISFVPVA